MGYALVGHSIGGRPTHLIHLDADGRIDEVRATCGGRRVATVADPARRIRDGRAMGDLPVVPPPPPAEIRVSSVGGDRMRLAHRECVDHYNSTIACGADHGDCCHRDCCMSAAYVPPTTEDERGAALARLRAPR